MNKYTDGRKHKRRVSVLVDPEDFERFKSKKIYEVSRGYPGFYENGRVHFLQREILGLTDSACVVRFENYNRKDLRRKNLVVHVVPETSRGRYAVRNKRVIKRGATSTIPTIY